MSRPCVCGGSNENCRYCNGLGTIDDGLATALIGHARRNDVDKVGFMPTLGRKGKRSAGQSKSAPAPSNGLGLVRCPEPGCAAMLNPRKVQKHMNKVHKKPESIPLHEAPKPKTIQVQSPVVPTAATGLVPCPVEGCTAKVKPSRIKGHIRRAHSNRLSKRAAMLPLRTGSVETRSHSRARYIVSNSAHHEPRRVSSYGQKPEKNLDSTKGYAHAYRESGRFGSHPSHDGFDDDSGPE